MGSNFGKRLKEHRIRNQLTLRECCQRLGVDPSNWSKLERGINPAPRDQRAIEQWADKLGLASGERQELLDLAALSRKEVPADLASDERVLEALPVFFRVARGSEMSEMKLQQFVDTVRRLHTADRDA